MAKDENIQLKWYKDVRQLIRESKDTIDALHKIYKYGDKKEEELKERQNKI